VRFYLPPAKGSDKLLAQAPCQWEIGPDAPAVQPGRDVLDKDWNN